MKNEEKIKEWKSLELRRGRFLIEKDAFKSGCMPDLIAWLEFVPTRVEFLYHLNAFEYIGMSKRFEILSDFSIPKDYQIITHVKEAEKGEVEEITFSLTEVDS